MTSNRGVITDLLNYLFTNAEPLEDDLEHFVWRSRAGQLVEASSRFVELGENQLLRFASLCVGAGARDGSVRAAHQRGVPKIRDARTIAQRVAACPRDERATQVIDPFVGDGRHIDRVVLA
jgi:hypothetical protein